MEFLLTSPHVAWPACGHMMPHASQGRTDSGKSARKHEVYQDFITQGNAIKIQNLNENRACKAELQDFQEESLRKVESLQNNPAFQEIVTELQTNTPEKSTASEDPRKDLKSELYIFLSFSMGEKAILNLAQETKRFGATLVLRGFIEGSYRKTAQALQIIITKTGQGVLIDPELYSLFNITAVPTFVLTKPFNLMAAERVQTPIHDKLQGHVSVRYALEQFEQQGDLKQEARLLLKKGANP